MALNLSPPGLQSSNIDWSLVPTRTGARSACQPECGAGSDEELASLATSRAGNAPSRAARLASAVALAVALAALATPAALAREGTRNVLVLYSFPRLQPANAVGDQVIHQMVQGTADRPVLLYDESLDAPRFSGPAYESIVVTYLREKYASRPPDVIAAVGEYSLDFLLRHRGELPAQVPIVHAGVDVEFLHRYGRLPPDVVGVPVELDFASTINLALRWHPGTRRVVIVTGTSEVDRNLEARLRTGMKAFESRVRVEFLAGLPSSEVLQRLAGLPRDAVVFTPGYFRDGAGRNCVPRDAVAAMAAASSAPVYSSFSTFIGTGIVGGTMATFETMARQAGEILNALLAGASPGSLQLPRVMPQAVTVDWRQVRRWGIDERAVPPDAVLYFKPPPLLQAYRREVIFAAGVFVVQAGLIALLLVEQRRRRLAEAGQEMQRLELAHASRLAIAGELTASIAHEINQPLGAILSNADAAELILESGGNRRDELHGILADIKRDDRRASEVVRRLRSLLSRHEVERREFDLGEVARDVELMLAGEARRRRVELSVRAPAAPVTMVGDRTQIQQVLINLMLNAMDAVAEVPGERRTVAVSVESGEERIAVTVRDRGHGIPPEHMDKLFESFFSTKREGMGLGLSIARTLVESHGGRIWAEAGCEEGAVFRIDLPAAGVTCDNAEEHS